MAKSKQQKLYEIGLTAYCEATGQDPPHCDVFAAGFLKAMAAMFVEVNEPKKRKPSGRTYEDRKVGERLHARLQDEAPNALAYSPVNTNTFSVIGKKLRDAGITEEDLTTLSEWLRSGPFDWRDSVPTWGEFTSKVIDWIALAKISQRGARVRDDVLARLREDDDL